MKRDLGVAGGVEPCIYIARAAEVELSQLSHGHNNAAVKWCHIESFYKMIQAFCAPEQSLETEEILKNIILEFCFGRPCRRRNDFPEVCFRENLKAISEEFCKLLDKTPLTNRLALRLYDFCHIFSKHFSEEYKVRHFSTSRVIPLELEVTP